jgi:polyhydroxyalkanoate synthesis regulator phasin
MMIKTAKTERAETVTKDTDTEIALLKRDVETIRDNHLKHMKDDIDRIERKVDKIDNRLYWVLGILVSTQIASMIANMI